ncbi:MAG: insulinase family protein [Leptothrix sp. (in: Bacteria)]|nr:insulinase family protein [Leptothrix sp. (in: b-proteobacteria)]
MLTLATAATAATAADSAPADTLPPFGADRPLPPLNVQRHTLANGLQLWVLPRNGPPRVDTLLVVRGAGHGADAADRPGQASLLADLMNEGTQQRDARALAEAVQALGGTLGAAAAPDGLLLNANALSSRAEPLIRLLAEVARQPAFAEKEVALARENALQGLKAAMATPGFRAEGALAKAIYGGHAYGRIQPTEASILATTAQALRAEHARRFRPDRTLLIVAGRVTPAQVRGWVQAAFGDWRAEGEAAPEPPAPPPAMPAQRLLLDRPGSVQATVRLGRPGAPASTPDDVALRLASTVLGGGFTSRINLNLREEKGYTYGASAGARSLRHGGSIVGGADVRNEVTGAALAEFVAEYRRLGSELVPADELQLNKRYLAGTTLLGIQQQAGLAATLARNWLVGLPPDFLGQFVPRLQRVSAAQVREMGRKYFAPEAQSIVVVGDPAAVAAQLKAFGDFVEPPK